ncbi:MAG: glycosyltransferase, partial [Bifidobacteriaceae bacterium]|nr:glycosyltransferase [Bifidobacteriaceae bacterium]
MSLAPAPTPAGTTGPGAPARRGGQAVVAVVVTRGRSVYLPRALVCLAEQTLTPSAVVLVDTGPHDDPGIREMALRCGLAPETLTVVRAQGAPTFARAVRAGLAATETHPDQLFFLLHDDCYAQADCLSALARAIELAPSVVIAGPKQLRADLPDTLGEVGVTTSRFGRRMTGAKDGELDQGQYDQREDVLGVGSAGMLIRADAWAELGGLDPWLGPFGDGLDLSRRARLAGHRVIVVPGAVVNHEQAAYRGLRGKSGKPDPRRSFWSRRRAFVYTQLVGLPLPLVPVALVAAVVMGIGRAVWRVATKEPVLALAELWGPLRAVLHPWRIAAARRRARHTRRLRRSTLRPLQATQREVRQLRRDRRLARADA